MGKPLQRVYAGGMDILPALAQGRLTLALIDSGLGHSWLMTPLAILARKGPVRVIDGGNHFDAYRLARALRWQGIDPVPVLEGVAISRAFTCHQVSCSLAQEFSPAAPLIVLDLLATFQDENVPLHERQRLFQTCLLRLKSFAQGAPVLVTARTGQADFSEALSRAADRVLHRDPPALPQPIPLW